MEGNHSNRDCPHTDSPLLLSSPWVLKLVLLHPTHNLNLATNRKSPSDHDCCVLQVQPSSQPATRSPGRDSAHVGQQSNQSHLGSSPGATSSPRVACNASHNKGRIGNSLCRLGTEKPKVTRGDRLEHQRTLVDLILDVLASRGGSSPSAMQIAVEDGITESRSCIEIVRLCGVCLHLAETKPDCLYRDHLGSVSIESDSTSAEMKFKTTEKEYTIKEHNKHCQRSVETPKFSLSHAPLVTISLLMPCWT
ncbi:hypothetical protein CR513_53776, partial [Mucuna pruriens]